MTVWFTTGRITYALVNDAGRGLVGAVEETSDQEARAAFDVNVFALLNVTERCCRTCAPSARAW